MRTQKWARNMKGWIKLHRQFSEWEWFTDAHTLQVFMYLLIKANHKPAHKYRGVQLAPGQLITGRKAIAQATGLTEQKVRTALKRLKSTNEITVKPTRKFSIVTLNQWAKYQAEAADQTNVLTHQTPTANQQLTTFNNPKNVKEGEKITRPAWQIWMHESQQWQERTLMAVAHIRRLTFEDLAQYINRFANLQLAKNRIYANNSEAAGHFVNWLEVVMKKDMAEGVTTKPRRKRI
jgi:predicted transcriptional regulator